MSDFEPMDLEDEIPANKIRTSEPSNRNAKLYYGQEYEEITLGHGDDENIEYVDYSDEEENIIYLDEISEEHITEENYADNNFEEIISEQNIKLEKGHEDEQAPAENYSKDMYHCSVCNIKFSSVKDHINKFHENQSVVMDGSDAEKEELTYENSLNDDFQNDVKVEYEEVEDIGNVEGEEIYTIASIDDDQATNVEEFLNSDVQSLNKSNCAETLADEKGFDSLGRPYVRKKVKLSGSMSSNTVLKCSSCDILFFNESDFHKHKCDDITKLASYSAYFTEKFINNDKTHVCSECNLEFQTLRSLSSHAKLHKNKNNRNVASSSKPKPKETYEDKTASCAICNTTFPTNKSLKLHLRMHDPIKTKAIEDAAGYELKACSRDKRGPNETFLCDICNKSYDIVFQDVHKKSHINGVKFTCTICNKKFTNQVNLGMHLKIHENQIKVKGQTKAEKQGITLPYPCSFCGREFARPHEKVKHERIHTGEKPYKCEICGKCFRVSYCLTLHLRTHTSARPYVCPHCNKRFKAYSVYNHHLMTHSDERPYKCPYCLKAFKTSVQLGGHKNSHTKPFSCPECNRPFASLYSVKAHMETHKRGSQNLKHRCTICGAIYARVFALRDHMNEQHNCSTSDLEVAEASPLCEETQKRGSQNLKYSCTICGATYARVFALRDHMKEQHHSSTSNVLDLDVAEATLCEESILPDNDNDEEITVVSEIEHFETEEIVTDWLK